jgi:hypothetical protein
LLITFGSGSDQYSRKTPSDFNFSTTHQQTFQTPINSGSFGLVNSVVDHEGRWHNGSPDHTENDVGGYMYLVNVAGERRLLFNATVNYLCIGQRYEFSAYLANIRRKNTGADPIKPNMLFQVRTATERYDLVAQSTTGNISESDSMIWSTYGLSFIASSSSVLVSIIPSVWGQSGNDIAIDDIEIRVCSTTHSGFCPPG